MQNRLGHGKRQIPNLVSWVCRCPFGVCSFPCLELGTSHQWLRKLVAPKLGTAPHHTQLVSSLLTPFATRKVGTACILGLLPLPTITQNMSIEAVKSSWGGKITVYCLVLFEQRVIKDIGGVSFMHNNMSFMFIFTKCVHGTSWIPKNLKRNTVNI